MTAGSGGVGGGGGAVMALQNWGAVLLSAAAREGVHAWDLRAHKRAFSLPGPAYQVCPKPPLQPLLCPCVNRADGNACIVWSGTRLAAMESKV